MTKDEALKLALEFIERVNKDGWILADFEPQMYATITAIKEALASQREWAGLTRDEKMEIINRLSGEDWVYALDAAEELLREKNQ